MKVYIFPRQPPGVKGNPYLQLMSKAFKKISDITVISSDGGVEQSILDFFRCLFADLVIINWPENLGTKRFPVCQLVVYIFVLTVLYLSRKRIVWILHNKIAHNGEDLIGKLCTKITMLFADFVVTHSSEGCTYYIEKYGKNNIYYYPHPPYVDKIDSEIRIELFDIIIWGDIAPYKQVAEFLEFMETDDVLKEETILICGKCADLGYLERIKTIVGRNNNIIFENQFFDDVIIADKIRESRLILFTYNGSSVLSSGSLAYSLPFCKKIIGPNLGAFRDLYELGLVDTYNSFDEISQLIDQTKINRKNIQIYLNRYTWENFVLVLREQGSSAFHAD